ncbi:hypothetical protein O181_058771 [Austropuccinia psidii MF-1]|uniref:MULE transposase domain-containing protein n=1 Tax=Austropuccinia psidii MF-1 TaxID=1389203 RepID=A0A9Q3HV55_9BASI|nr:hypothetical protein [Austropuccinia psidii MF-1]
MTHNQIERGCDRSRTPNPNKNSSKMVTSRKLDCPFRLYARKYSKSTTRTLKVKNTEHSHDTTENIMSYPAFRKFNEQETSQIAQMSELMLMPGKIQAQLCSHRGSDRPVILQEIYNKLKKIKKEKLQGRRPIDAVIDTLKEENFVWSSARDAEGHISSLFFTPPCHKTPAGLSASQPIRPFLGLFCLMKNETEPSYTWELNQYINKVLPNTNIVHPPVIVIDRDLALKNSVKKLFPDSKVMLCIWNINKHTDNQGDHQSVEKERKNEAKRLFEDIGEDLFQRTMEEINPILQHFQDFLTGKVPFDQIPKNQEDHP